MLKKIIALVSMALETKPADPKWELLGPNPSLGPIEFMTDGSFSVNGMQLRPENVQNCDFGGVVIDGSDGLLTLDIPDGPTHVLRFTDGVWSRRL